MSVARQWVAEAARFAPGLRVHLHHGSDRLADAGARSTPSAGRRRRRHVLRHRHARRRDARRDRLGSAAARRGAGREEPADEARARAAAHSGEDGGVAMTGTPIENHLGELWALMDILNPGLLGSREWFARTFQRPIQLARDEAALERLRAIVRPFILRRTKESPEVELDLPPITVEKDYCRLTVEQAGLYQATVDHWLPRIEAHEDRFGRRGAVLAMLAHLKQVCNHPEMLVHTGAPLDAARASSSASSSCSPTCPRDRQGARLHAVPELRPPRPVSERAARPRGRLLPRPAQRAAARGAAGRVRERRTGRRCSSSRSARAAAA